VCPSYWLTGENYLTLLLSSFIITADFGISGSLMLGIIPGDLIS